MRTEEAPISPEKAGPAQRTDRRITIALMASQAIYNATVSVDLTLTALAGLALASSPALATLPLALITLVGAMCSVIAGYAQSRFGHTKVMTGGAVIGILGGVLSMAGALGHDFLLLCLGTGLAGAYRATGGYIRLLAADLAPPNERDRALSLVLSGGLIAAVVGPWLATGSMNMLPAPFAGSYLTVALLCLAATALCMFLGRLATAQGERSALTETAPALLYRELGSKKGYLTALLLLGAAGAIMTVVMAVGPLANQHAGHSTDSGASLIQWHMVAMFAPSLFSGMLLSRLGAGRMAVAGLLLFLLGSVAGLSGVSAWNLIATLAVNGLGWNFLYVAGTSYLVASYPAGRGGRLQAVAEGVSSATAVLASTASAAVFLALGWAGTNLAVLCITLGTFVTLLASRISAPPRRRIRILMKHGQDS